MTLAACTYLLKLVRLKLSWAIAVCVRSCFITSVMFAMQPWYCSERILTSRTDNSRLLQRCLGTTSKTGQRVRKDIASDWVLHHDKAPAHTALSIREFLAKKNIPTLPHPPYSSDLAPCDFYLFPKLKSKLKNSSFSDCNRWAKNTRRKWFPVLLQSMERTLETLCNFLRVILRWR
jgi:hypothetical protein